jgi:uncharacterized protein
LTAGKFGTEHIYVALETEDRREMPEDLVALDLANACASGARGSPRRMRRALRGCRQVAARRARRTYFASMVTTTEATATPDLPIPRVRQEGSGAGPAVAMLLIAGAALALHLTIGWRQAALFLVGAGAGLVLYHAAFGFTSAFRVFISDRRGAGLRAQMVMLAVACAIFVPLLASGSAFGQPLRGSMAPAGVPVLAGAFIFGIGMQLGGGCASGTLFTLGGGSVRMLVTLLFFIVGSVAATAHSAFWHALPSLPPTSLVATWGAGPALLASLTMFGGLAATTVVLERRRHGRLLGEPNVTSAAWLRGPWPLIAGALGLAAVNVATLLLAGRPWGVTSAFALWGAKALAALGVPVETWPYWSAPAQAAALRASVLADVTSVMNAGIVLGALLAALLAGRFRPAWRTSGRSLAAAVIGGLLLGYGARVAYGCNIGAYFSGIASGSLHGWLWLPAALAGSVVGTALRPLFDLRVERTPRC